MAGKESRKSPRVSKLCFTSVKRYDTTGELEEAQVGKTLNISDGGILLETDHPLPFMAQLEIVIGLDDEMLKLKGEVVHLLKKEDGALEMGIRFLEVSSKDRETLRNSLIEGGLGNHDSPFMEFFG